MGFAARAVFQDETQNSTFLKMTEKKFSLNELLIQQHLKTP